MCRFLIVVLAFSALMIAGLFVETRAAEPERSLLGHRIEDVRFIGPDNKAVSLHDVKGKKAIVVVFLSFECPVSNSYVTTLNDMARKFAEAGVAFIGVCPCEEGVAQVEKWAKEFKLAFPVYRDDRLAATRAFRAEVTPTAFLLDSGFALRYRGRVDDSFTARLKRNSTVASHDLCDALEQLLANKPIREPATSAIGCRIRQADTAAATGKVAYYRDVLPILQAHCQTCHRPGEIGPFALMTHKQAVNWAEDIKEYTKARKMPPWMPTEGVAFHNERKLTVREIETLAAWVDGGTPAGDARDAPKPRAFTEGWQLGKPDLILSPDRDMVIGATGEDLFRAYVLPTNLTEGRYVVAYEVRPGNTRVVHHTLNFLDTTGAARRLLKREEDRKKSADESDRGPGYSSRMGPGFLPRGDVGGWAPGITPHRMPAEVGYYLPKGSDIVIQVHYHRTGRIEIDRPQLGLYFAQKPLAKPIQPIVIAGRFTTISPGVENYDVTGRVWVDRDCTVYNVTPHMHLIGKKIKVTMTPPGGETTTLVNIEEWNYNWQEKYFFKKPIAVKSGTRFDVEAVYDNSAKNPNNPSKPPRRVWVGEGTTNEMCFGFLDATSDDGQTIGFRLSKDGYAIRLPRLLPNK